LDKILWSVEEPRVHGACNGYWTSVRGADSREASSCSRAVPNTERPCRVDANLGNQWRRHCA
jgi:hypothetical protein